MNVVLKEHRPGRYVRIDPETGQVLGLATDAEADRWIRANLLDQTEPAGDGRNGGALGVGAAVRPERLPQLCRQYGLRMPRKNGNEGGDDT